MLDEDEYFGRSFDVFGMDECLSVTLGDENDFRDLYICSEDI